MIRTKIVATMGPACSSVETLHALFQAGVNICRLNFSHDSLAGQLQTLRNVRQAAVREESPIAILGDLGGPKIRLGPISDENGAGGMLVSIGDQIIIQRQPIVGSNKRMSTTYPSFVDDLRIGDRVLIEDGMLRFVVTEKTYNEVHCQCTAGGILKSAKGINLPGTPVNLPSITERDWECVDWAIENDLDYLALSFVRRADEINLLREHLRNKSSDIHIIAKIEKSEAIEQIDAIIDASDGLMIASGDLGVEMDVAEVPIIQKDLIRRCQAAGKPVIVATQMLQSMIEQSSPTRAEVSDVANAIFDGADAVMLSGETSVGKFPVGAVHTMEHVARVTEDYIVESGLNKEPPLKLKTMQFSAAVANGVRRITEDLKVKLVVVYSQTGATARIFSKSRLAAPILALSSDHRALRRMALHYGVIPQEMPPPTNMDDLVNHVDELVRSREIAAIGERIVIVAGSSLGTPGTLNGIILHTVGENRGTEGE
ncbi:MAG TPA: pyruvate kinase [Tepidisphaeraceae bacterium]|nr:pyruvate kinase [Tepidisphaeraceae bacterium]